MTETTKCRSCGARIVWAETEDGKRIPLNATRARAFNLISNGEDKAPTAKALRDPGAKEPSVFYVSHFLSCPDASKHSKGKGAVARGAAGGPERKPEIT